MLSSQFANALDGRCRTYGRYPALSLPCPYRPNMKTGKTTTIASVATTMTLACLVGAAAGQQPEGSQVEQAAFNRPVSGSAAQKVSFARQAIHVGDKVEQNIELDLR